MVAAIPETSLDDDGLGEWDVRALLGHACRAFTTIEAYLRAGEGGRQAITLRAPADYFHAAAVGLADPAQVTQRGRDAGHALGGRPIAAALDIVERVTMLVAQTPDEAVIATPVGGVRLIDYLPTRAFEVTVHGIDLARATRQPIPPDLLAVLEPTIALCSSIADVQQQLSILVALTGREPLPQGFSIL